MLDDSNPEKIRKSIFMFASIMLFSYFYELQITAPKSLFSSANIAVKDIKISYEDILFILSFFQLYLLTRLFLAWRISKAKFKKFWIMDEFEDREDKSDLIAELNTFNEFCSKNSFPTFINTTDFNELALSINDEIKNAAQLISHVNSSVTNHENIESELKTFINKSNRFLRVLISDKNLLSENEQAGLLTDFPHIERTKPDAQDPKFSGDLYTTIETYVRDAHKLENNTLKPAIKNIEQEFGEVQAKLKSLSSSISSIDNINNRYNSFVNIFPQSNYKLAIDVKPSDLTKSKKFEQ